MLTSSSSCDLICQQPQFLNFELSCPIMYCQHFTRVILSYTAGVGKVVKNGPGATQYKEGQRVSAAPWPQFQGRGSWGQYVAVPEKDLVGFGLALP